ncbi:MAG: formate dehydrogenase accessory sulfurtransferase FdhD [Candidatus Thermoplasmatota archaeon]|nr:formate dehydrogenase accessory sulfurtransferase FdhD [Candidatus Thermoplasmatota archaeon]
MEQRTAELAAQRFTSSRRIAISDAVAIEEPLQILINGVQFAITMRTPGDDEALVYGLLLSEGIIRNRDDISSLNQEENEISVTLEEEVSWSQEEHARSFSRTSSCGVCGRASLESMMETDPPETHHSIPMLTVLQIDGLGDALNQAQIDFEATGGMHAVARFDENANFIDAAEDVGRHNALDKVIGRAVLRKENPLSKQILMLSGRVSFEMVQKAVMAGIPIISAIGAPTTLAVDLARQHGLTLIGFARENRFNVYSGAWRIE